VRPDEVVGVEVPASSANLGPGYDALAVALDLRLAVWTAERQDSRVLAEGEGAAEVPAGDDNLIWRALLAYCDWAGAQPPDVSLRARNPIPLARGMGSSAAAAVAGVALGRGLTRAGGSDPDLVALVAALEGHADNAAAAVLGGLCVVADGIPHRLEPSDALRPVLCVPPTRQSTAEARGLVPQTVSVAEAAANGARAALVVAGLTGAAAWDARALRDVLHEPPRLAAMAASGALVERLRALGVGACLSGAGPSVLAVVSSARHERQLDEVRETVDGDWTVLPLRWNRAGASLCPPGILTARE
jgi:homoserine kinase